VTEIGTGGKLKISAAAIFTTLNTHYPVAVAHIVTTFGKETEMA